MMIRNGSHQTLASWMSTPGQDDTLYVVLSFLANDVLLVAVKSLLQILKPAFDLLRSLAYIFQGADIIHYRYVRAGGHNFDVQTPGKKHHMIVSTQHIDELNRAPLNVLSLHAVAKDFLQPRDTMHGFEWSNIRGQEGTGFVRALRHVLTKQLPQLRPAIHRCVSDEIRDYLETHETSPGSSTSEPSVFQMTRQIVAHVNCLVFFGPLLSKNSAFLQAATAFPYEAAWTAEIIRLLPCKLTRWLARCFTQDHRAATTFYDLLYEEVRRRMEAANAEGNDSSSQGYKAQCDDGLQWLINSSARKQNWDVARMVGEVMGIWYGAVHTLSISIAFALLDLYSRSDQYVNPLRSELAQRPLRAQPGEATDLPLMDAFLKESARLSAFETTAVRRQALQPFTFRDGLVVQTGDWVCVPTKSMMLDEKRIHHALIFDAWRHLDRTDIAGDSFKSVKRQSFLTDHNGPDGDGTMIWGLSRIICPGRFYAALVEKLVLGVFLEEYDVTLPPIRGERSFQWRSSIVPKSNIRIKVTQRQ